MSKFALTPDPPPISLLVVKEGWFYGNSTFFLIQLKAMAIAVGYSFAVSFIIFKVINIIVPLRVTSDEEEEGLDASQHDEKYVQGTLLVATPNGLKEQEITH